MAESPVRVDILADEEFEDEIQEVANENEGSELAVSIPEPATPRAEEAVETMDMLDPNHPLMHRVQAALKDQLTRQKDKLEIELREKQEDLKSKKSSREELGVELYGLQQQLGRQQMMLEKEQDSVSVMNQQRKQKESGLQQARQVYLDMQDQLKQQRRSGDSLRKEVDTLRNNLRLLMEAQSAVQTDIATTKRATEKTDVDIARAKEEKREQDLYVNRLTEEVQNLEEQVALYAAQTKVQTEENRSLKDAITESATELETLNLEKKNLYQKWSNSLLGMQKRDEAYAAMLTALKSERDTSLNLDTELDSCKKATTKEEERNEQLTGMLRKLDTDTVHVKRQLEQSLARRDQLKEDYMIYTRTLQEVEETLEQANTDCTLRKNELNALRIQIEREALEKRKLEDGVMEKLLYQLTMDKATQHTRKMVEKLRQRAKQMETDLVTSENECAKHDLEMTQLQSRLEMLHKQVAEQNREIEGKNSLISQSENEIARNNHLIERKQTQIDQLNKKLSQMALKSEGREELGPLEARIQALQKQISDSKEESQQMEQYWLRQQSNLVRRTRDADQQRRALERLNREQLILDQKKLRLDGEVSSEERDIQGISKGIQNLHKDLQKLGSLVTVKKGEQDLLQQSNLLIEGDFVSTLKEAELETICLQSQLEQIKEEKKRLSNALLESEQQIMLWERKIKLAKEMKETVDSDVGQAEIRGMTAEIHRMEVHHASLMRRQEQMIQDMEKAVYRREAILLRGEAQNKAGMAENTRGQLRKKVEEMKKKLKQTTESISFCEEEMNQLLSSQKALGQELDHRQRSCKELQGMADTLENHNEELSKTKQQMFNELLASQQRLRNLGSVKDGKFKMSASKDRLRDIAVQEERLLTLVSIADSLSEDFPQSADALKKVHSMASWKAGQIKDKTLVVA